MMNWSDIVGPGVTLLIAAGGILETNRRASVTIDKLSGEAKKADREGDLAVVQAADMMIENLHNDVTDVRQQLVALRKTQAQLVQDNAELKRENVELKRGLDQMKAELKAERRRTYELQAWSRALSVQIVEQGGTPIDYAKFVQKLKTEESGT